MKIEGINCWETRLLRWKEKRIESSDIKGMKQIANLIGEISEWLVKKK